MKLVFKCSIWPTVTAVIDAIVSEPVRLFDLHKASMLHFSMYMRAYTVGMYLDQQTEKVRKRGNGGEGGERDKHEDRS